MFLKNSVFYFCHKFRNCVSDTNLALIFIGVYLLKNRGSERRIKNHEKKNFKEVKIRDELL